MKKTISTLGIGILLSFSAITLNSKSAEAITFNFSWSGDPTQDTNITTTDDPTLKATGIIEINKLAGESFTVSDIGIFNISVTGQNITGFNISSVEPFGGSISKFAGIIAADGLSASLDAFYSSREGGQKGFGCNQVDAECLDGQIGILDDFEEQVVQPVVNYNTQENALRSLSLTVSEAVPEPVTILGTLLAGSLGIAFKKKGQQN